MSAIFPVIKYGNPVLTIKSEPVTTIGPDIIELLNTMVETMYVFNGVGLAAPQVSRLVRVIVFVDRNKCARKMINPLVISYSGAGSMTEGCLSLPNLQLDIVRPSKVVIEYIDENENKKTESLSSLEARIVQHEIDHLDGKVILDHLSAPERAAVEKKWRNNFGTGVFQKIPSGI